MCLGSKDIGGKSHIHLDCIVSDFWDRVVVDAAIVYGALFFQYLCQSVQQQSLALGSEVDGEPGTIHHHYSMVIAYKSQYTMYVRVNL